MVANKEHHLTPAKYLEWEPQQEVKYEVSCDERDRRATKFIQYPCLIVEVLSDSTEAYDRGDKFKKYRCIETLTEYVLVEAEARRGKLPPTDFLQNSMGVDLYRLNRGGVWELRSYEEEDEIHLECIDFTFPVSLLYEDVILDT